MTLLPAEGRQGPAPAWPLPADVRGEAQLRLLGERIAVLALDAQGRGRKAQAAQQRLLELRVQAEVLSARLRLVAELEATVWAQLWALPQAVLWDRQQWLREVAQYTRWHVLGELGELPAAREARQLADRLLLNPMALLRGRCEIVSDELATRRQASAAASGSAARDRLQVTDPDAADTG